MTETKPSNPGVGQSATEAGRVRFVDEGVKNCYANACNVSSTREEIVLNFGLNQAWERPQQEVQVQLTNRIILNPHTAKRVALLLGAVVQQYEKQYGILEVGQTQAQGSSGQEMKPHAVK